MEYALRQISHYASGNRTDNSLQGRKISDFLTVEV